MSRVLFEFDNGSAEVHAASAIDLVQIDFEGRASLEPFSIAEFFNPVTVGIGVSGDCVEVQRTALTEFDVDDSVTFNGTSYYGVEHVTRVVLVDDD